MAEKPYGYKLCACRLSHGLGHLRLTQRQHTRSALENRNGKGPLAEKGVGVFKVASSTQVPTPQLKLVGTQSPSSGFCSLKKKNKKKDYCLLLQDQVGKFCGTRKKLNLLQCLLYGWKCRDRHVPKSLAQEAFLCFLHSHWTWLCSAHRSITTYSITGFFSLILLLNFLQEPSEVYFSSGSLVERRQVATLPFRLG